MKKPKKLEAWNGEVVLETYRDGIADIRIEPPARKEYIELIESHNNLVEVINYLWDHVQSNNAELVDLTDD